MNKTESEYWFDRWMRYLDEGEVTLETEDRGIEGDCENMKTIEEYIYEAVELSWRWYRTKELRNSVDSGIRCMDIDDDFIISTDNLRIGSGPGIAALVNQLQHQTGDKPLSSIDQLKQLVDSGTVKPQSYDD